MGKAVALDFTNVKDGGGAFRKVRQPAGDYKGTITKAQTVKVKSGENKGQPQWLFTIKAGSGTYPYYCGFAEDQLWKIRNLFVSAGIVVPKKKIRVDPDKVVGKSVGVTLDDDEYDGKMQSSIGAVFPLNELEGAEDEGDDDEDSEDEDSDDDTSTDDDDEEEPEPEPVKKKKKKKQAPAEDLEELDIDDI